MANDDGRDVKCPSCGVELKGSDLATLKCPACGEDLPPRLGI
jgi:predicted RNA-binding Zn-ribbon protein involved in translation (DUF1610 family)